MSVLDTEHKKKSFVITLILHILLLILLFFIGLQIQEEEPEGGIAVNFGTTITGSGDQQPTEPIKATPKQTTPDVTPPPPEEVQEEVPEIKDQVVTQEVEEAPVIEKKPEKKPKKKTEKPQEKPKEVTPEAKQLEKKVDKPVKKIEEKKPDPKPDKATSDALDSFLNGPKSDGKATGGEGDDNTAGDKGDPNGDPNAKSYYGNGKGLDGDGNYRLGGRKALNKEKFVQECNESGIVVVKIEVDQSGKVIKATPGVKGTTNNTACLMNPAKRAALATRFNSDSKAPAKQIGTIRYQFKLSE